jgi:hypothetical protein
MPLSTATQPDHRTSSISQVLRSIGPEDADGAAESEPLFVRPISGDDELNEVYRLTHDAYVERGYCSPQPDGRLIHYPHLDRIPQTTVAVALQGGRIVGTVSWTLDGPAGLHVDHDFKAECDAIRRSGARIVAGWRIATRSDCRSERAVVMALIRESVRGHADLGATVSLFTFNPRHERIYQRILNMKTIGRSDSAQGLKNAPAVLMRLDRESIPARWFEPVTV